MAAPSTSVSPAIHEHRATSVKPRSADVTPGPGFRFRECVAPVDVTIVDRLACFETPAISDRMNRLYSMDHAIRALNSGAPKIAGRACTVKVYPGDNLMVHKSLDIAEPGDVVVVDAASATTFAVLGDMVATKARHRGIAGFVVDGLVRDLPGILALGDLPVFARGVTPIGPLHRGPGEINYPVCAGGIVVHPGDIVIGDPSGVVVIPLECAREVAAGLERHAEADRAYAAAVAQGTFSTAWVDEELRAGGLHDH